MNLKDEKYTLHHSSNLYYRLVVGGICMERNRHNSYSYIACYYFPVTWNHQKSIGFSIQSFPYTRSILSARLQFSTVAILIYTDVPKLSTYFMESNTAKKY